MRGRTLNHAFIILDEAQNTTPEQMKMFLTRIGIGAKAVVTGDLTQVDLQRGQVSGLREARDVLGHVRGIATTNFLKEDVVRHPLVARIVEAYELQEARRLREGSGRRPGAQRPPVMVTVPRNERSVCDRWQGQAQVAQGRGTGGGVRRWVQPAPGRGGE